MYKVGIIGPESSGKSTLARYLAKRYNGVLIPEYAREYVERKGTTEVTFDELCFIAKHQIEELERLSTHSLTHSLTHSFTQPVFFDTELIITKVWFDYAFGRVPEWLNENIHRFPMDVYLLTYPDIAWVPDPARSTGSDAIRKELFDRYEAEIQSLDIPYYIIRHV